MHPARNLLGDPSTGPAGRQRRHVAAGQHSGVRNPRPPRLIGRARAGSEERGDEYSSQVPQLVRTLADLRGRGRTVTCMDSDAELVSPPRSTALSRRSGGHWLRQGGLPRTPKSLRAAESGALLPRRHPRPRIFMQRYRAGGYAQIRRDGSRPRPVRVCLSVRPGRLES
jgi:hypothetical protein